MDAHVESRKTKTRIKKISRFSVVFRQLRKNKLAMAGLVVIILLMLVAIFAPYIMPFDYDQQNWEKPLVTYSREHPLGTDHLGRDILSRLIYGTRISLFMGVSIVILGSVIGILLGGIAGYCGGKTDNIIMRFLDIYQSIPAILLAIALASAVTPGIGSTIIVLSIASFPANARLMRASILQVRQQEYIEASHAISASNLRILLTHVLPNAFSPMIVFITMYIGAAILVTATLSFIGLGVQPPTPEWGSMLARGRGLMRDHPTLVLYPGLMIMITVLALNLFGDGLRDALDPRLKN